MKTVTTREFYHAPGLVKALAPGQSLEVTDNGKPSFRVIKAGKRPVKTAKDLLREAREIFPDERPPVNTVALLRKLRE